MMAIGIDSYALAGNIDALWESWVTQRGDALPPEPDSARCVRVLAACIQQVLANAKPAERPGLVLATTKGDIDAEIAWVRRGNGVTDGRDNAPGLPTLGRLAASLAHEAGLAPAWVVSTACTSGLVALIDAACALLAGEARAMVVAAVDVAGSFVQQGFGALKAVSPTRCRPFDKARDGLIVGTGAAACLLARHAPETPASASLSRVVLRGWGLAGDATHMTAPDREARGLIRAMQSALRQSRLEPGEIDVVFAHGTGTRYNDAMEATAIRRVFGDQGARPPVTAVKGLIGHTLGASGLVEALLTVRMIETGVVPPVAGLNISEYPELDLVQSARERRIRNVLKVASGFGGLNAAVVFSS